MPPEILLVDNGATWKIVTSCNMHTDSFTTMSLFNLHIHYNTVHKTLFYSYSWHFYNHILNIFNVIYDWQHILFQPAESIRCMTMFSFVLSIVWILYSIRHMLISGRFSNVPRAFRFRWLFEICLLSGILLCYASDIFYNLFTLNVHANSRVPHFKGMSSMKTDKYQRLNNLSLPTSNYLFIRKRSAYLLGSFNGRPTALIHYLFFYPAFYK